MKETRLTIYRRSVEAGVKMSVYGLGDDDNKAGSVLLYRRPHTVG